MQGMKGEQDQPSRGFLTKEGITWKNVSLMLILLVYVIEGKWKQ